MNFSHFTLKAGADDFGKAQLVDLPNDVRVRFLTAETVDNNLAVRVTYSRPSALPSAHRTPRAFIVADVDIGLGGTEDAQEARASRTKEDQKLLDSVTRVSEIGNVPGEGLIVFERHTRPREVIVSESSKRAPSAPKEPTSPGVGSPQASGEMRVRVPLPTLPHLFDFLSTYGVCERCLEWICPSECGLQCPARLRERS